MGNKIVTEVLKHTVNDISNDIKDDMNNTKDFICKRALAYLIGMIFIMILCLVVLKVLI